MNEEVSRTVLSPDVSQPIDAAKAINEPSQEIKPNNKPNKWLVIGLIIFVLAVLAIAGFFAYRYFQLKKNEISGKTAPALSPAPTSDVLPTGVLSPIPTTDPTSSWSAYTNDSFCYTFKYPPQITLQVRSEEKIVHLSLVGPTQKQDTEFFDGISLSFSFPLEIGGTSLKDYTSSHVEESKQTGEILKPIEAITVNGINGYTYTVQGLGTFKNIYLQSPDKTCTIEITDATIDPTKQGYPETVEKILSTLEFK